MKMPIPVRSTKTVAQNDKNTQTKIERVTVIKQKLNSSIDTLEALDKYDSVNEQEEFLKTLDSIMATSSHIMQDPRLDISELPKAKNSYEFYTGKNFLNFKPYARQLEFTGKLELSVCPYCSPDFYDDPHDFKAPYQSYIRDFAYYEDGICPDCKRSRVQALSDGELDEKYILIGIAGQRCVCTSTLVYTPLGPKPISQLVNTKETKEYVNTPMGISIATDYFDQDRQEVYRVTSASGRFVDVTVNHRLFIAGDNYLTYRGEGKEKGYRRGNELELSPLDSQRKFSLDFIEPCIDTASKINFGASIAKFIMDFIANTKRIDLSAMTMEKMKKTLGKINIGKTADDILPGEFAVADITNKWLWGSQTQTNRDAFFLGLAQYSCTGALIYAAVPYPWINAYFAWLDELGIEASAVENSNVTNGVILLKLDAIHCKEAKLPLDFMFGKGTADYIHTISHELRIDKFNLYYRGIGEKVDELLGMFGKNKNQYEPVPMQLGVTSWNDCMEDITIFCRKALDYTIREDITKDFLNSLTTLESLLGQASIGKGHIYSKIKEKIYSLRIEIEKLHGKRFSPILSIRKIGKTDTCDIEVADVSCFFANGIHSHNSSKSRTATMLALTKMHNLLMTGNPAEYYGLLSGQVLSAIFTAGAIEQAAKNMYVPGIKNMLETEAPWFANFNKWLKEREHVIGKKLFKIQETQATYIFGNLWLGCLSPDIRTIRGRTSFFTATDELAYFDTDDSKMRAGGLEVTNALMNSIQTTLNAARKLRRNGMTDVIFPLHSSISSIFSETDPIVTWAKRQRNNPGTIYFKLPTWRFNPEFTEKQLRIDNPTDTFDRDFGSIPQKTGGTFIKMATLKTMLGDRKNGAKLMRIEYVNQKTGVVYTSAKCHITWRAKPNGLQTLMSLDAGLKDNSFSVSIGHVDPEDGAFIVDVVGEIQPLPDRDIHFSALCHSVLGELIDAFNCKIVVSDRWNSAKLLQDISDEFGMEVYTHQLKYKDFISWRNDATNGRIIMPREEMDLEDAVLVTNYHDLINMPVAHFFQQCSTVTDNGKIIDKAKGFTDDIFRAVVLGWRLAQEQEVRDVISSEDIQVDQGPLIVSSTELGPIKPREKSDFDPNKMEMKPIYKSFGGNF